jgi:ankyrin repeat protein
MQIFLAIFTLFFLGCSTKNSINSGTYIYPHPCFQAAAKGDLSYLAANIKFCLTQKTTSGTTVLMLASSKGQIATIEFLLNQGALIDEVDNFMATAINYAVVGNQSQAASMLILWGADLNSKRPDGISALMMAIQLGTLEMVRIMTMTKKSLNSASDDGWTPLFFAVKRKDFRILSLLLYQGACKNVQDNDGDSPLDVANEMGWLEAVKLIQDSPACSNNKINKLNSKKKAK